MLYRKLLFGAACLVFPAALASQEVRQVSVGDRVRVLAPSLGAEPRNGVLSRLSSGQLYVSEAGVGETLVVPANQLMRLDVWGRGRGSQAGKGAAIGAISGGLLFGVGGYIATRCPGHCANGEYASGLGALLAIPGAGAGALVGGLLGRSARSVGWQPVDLPLRVSVLPPMNHRISFSGSLVF